MKGTYMIQKIRLTAAIALTLALRAASALADPTLAIEVGQPLDDKSTSIGILGESAGDKIRAVIAIASKGGLAQQGKDGSEVRYFEVSARLGSALNDEGQNKTTFMDFELVPLAYYLGPKSGNLQIDVLPIRAKIDSVLDINSATIVHLVGWEGDSKDQYGAVFIRAVQDLLGFQSIVHKDSNAPANQKESAGFSMMSGGAEVGLQGSIPQILKVRVSLGFDSDLGITTMAKLDAFARASVILQQGISLVAQGGTRLVQYLDDGGSRDSDKSYEYISIGLSGSF
jgi:hypothetical protein